MTAASIISSVVTAGTNNHSTVSEEANAYATDFVSQGIVGAIGNSAGAGPSTGGFGLSQDASPDMGVLVNLGVGYVLGTPTSQGSQMLRARMTTNYTSYTINANASGSTKYDWIYLQLSATNAATPSASADNVITLLTSRSSSNVSDNGTPPTYGLLLGVVTVANGASSITNGNISDRRIQSAISNSTTTSTTGWQSLNAALTYGANNGNKEFTMTAPTDLTSTLSTGMKLRVPRAVTPPTQSMAFASASSQYATKASPSGITFTGVFTCESWVYLNSYTAQDQYIIGRRDGTAGWDMRIDATGHVRLAYGASSSFTDFLTYQSVPLNQWVHIAGVVTSVSSKTGAIYINGVSVSTRSTLTAATTLAQATQDLRVAAFSTPANSYLNGYLSEVRVWSAAQTQQNIRDNMTVNLVGSETNLIALYEGNGAFTDATSNANNLTQSGGAIATQAANPYNTNEYAVIEAISYSNPTTTITVSTGNVGTIPNQALGSVSYSNNKAPYGFPSDSASWSLSYVFVGNSTGLVTGSIASAWGAMTGSDILIPTGKWRVQSAVTITGKCTSTATFTIQSQWDTTTPANDLPGQDVWRANVTTAFLVAKHHHLDGLSTSSGTTYKLFAAITGGAGTQTAYMEDLYKNYVMIMNAYI